MNIQNMRKSSTMLLACVFLFCVEMTGTTTLARRRPPAGGRVAVVVDERLSALRATPEFNGILLRRIGRGGLVAVRGENEIAKELSFTVSRSPAGPRVGFSATLLSCPHVPATMTGCCA